MILPLDNDAPFRKIFSYRFSLREMLCIEFIAKTKPLVFSRNCYHVEIGAKMFIEISPTSMRKKNILYNSAQ